MSIQTLILQYLTDKDWIPGGHIDDFIRSEFGSKAGNVGRRCRELVDAGKLYRRLSQVDGKGVWFVSYKLVDIPFEEIPQMKGTLEALDKLTLKPVEHNLKLI